MDADPEPCTVIDHRVPVKGSTCGYAWIASWDRVDDWEGADVQYRDIYAAFPLVLAQYVFDEYAYTAGRDPDADAPDATFTWRCARGVWRLFENGEKTGVRLHSVEIVGI